MVEVLRVFTILLVGIVLGAVLAMLLISLTPEAMSTAVLIGVVAGLALFVLFVLFRSFLVTAAMRQTQRAMQQTSGAGPVLVNAILRRLLPNDSAFHNVVEDALRQGKKGVSDVLSAGAAIWGAMTSLALAVAVAGGVVSLANVVVGQRQIQRLDAQNTLIEEQISEFRATRVSSVFVAQLPGLLDASRKRRPTAGRPEWDIGPNLIAQYKRS